MRAHKDFIYEHAPGWILGLRQDLEQLAVREEEEPGEALPLSLEVVVEALSDQVQQLVRLLQLLQDAVDLNHLGENTGYVYVREILVAFLGQLKWPGVPFNGIIKPLVSWSPSRVNIY